MNKTRTKDLLVVCVLCLSTLLSFQAGAEDQDLTYSLSFTDPELDDLLAPIALYPDPLLAQMLPASTYPTEIADADAWLRSGGNVSNIDDQNWDESIKAIARYPDILRMMADNLDWTANLGDAFLNQPEDVTESIQRLRQQARNMGNLVSNNEQTVDIEEGNIQIIPAQPQYIYVPLYDPVVVYVQRPYYGIPPFIIFGPPLILGGWMIMDFDWGHHQVIYHGWNRRGWVNHARPHVHVTNVYINNSRPYLHRKWRHDASHGDPARYLASRPSGPHANRYARTGEVRGRTIQPRPAGRMFTPGINDRSYSKRGRESRGTVTQQPMPPAPGVSQRPAIPSPSIRERRTIPTPKVSQRPATLSPSTSERRVIPPSAVGQRPTAPSPRIREQRTIPTPKVGQRPATSPPQGDTGLSRSRPVRESVQPAGRPSSAFGGYRGSDEARAQSLRGQTSRQTSPGARPSPGPAKRDSSPAGKGAHGDKQRR